MKPHHVRFLKLICSEMTYKEIAKVMGKSEGDALNYASFLCQKLKVTGRFGLMLYAIKTKIVKPNEIKFKRIEGRPTLPEGLKVAIGGTLLLEGQSELLPTDQREIRKTNDRNDSKGKEEVCGLMN